MAFFSLVNTFREERTHYNSQKEKPPQRYIVAEASVNTVSSKTYFWIIASEGQAAAHAPQSIHESASIT